jgi:hypothetical protein
MTVTQLAAQAQFFVSLISSDSCYYVWHIASSSSSNFRFRILDLQFYKQGITMHKLLSPKDFLVCLDFSIGMAYSLKAGLHSKKYNFGGVLVLQLKLSFFHKTLCVQLALGTQQVPVLKLIQCMFLRQTEKKCHKGLNEVSSSFFQFHCLFLSDLTLSCCCCNLEAWNKQDIIYFGKWSNMI